MAYLRRIIGLVVSWTWLVAIARWVSPGFIGFLISLNAWWIQRLVDLLNKTALKPLAMAVIAVDQFCADIGKVFTVPVSLMPFFSLAGIATLLLGNLVMKWVWNRIVYRIRRRNRRRKIERQAFEEEVDQPQLSEEPEPEPKFSFPVTDINWEVQRIDDATKSIERLSRRVVDSIAFWAARLGRKPPPRRNE